jgi:hypothetical protein
LPYWQVSKKISLKENAMLILLSVYLYKFHLKSRMGRIIPFLKKTGVYYAFRPSELKPIAVISSYK